MIVFDSDLEIDEVWLDEGYGVRGKTRNRSEGEVIRFLVDRFASFSISLIDLFSLGIASTYWGFLKMYIAFTTH